MRLRTLGGTEPPFCTFRNFSAFESMTVRSWRVICAFGSNALLPTPLTRPAS